MKSPSPAHHRTRARSRSAVVGLVAASLLLAACAKSHPAAAPANKTTTTRPTSTTTAVVNEHEKFKVVPEKGSVLDALSKIPGTTKFAKIVASLPKQVFVQQRGITLLVPWDGVMSQALVDQLVKDPNAASTFISHYLSVGGSPLAKLGGSMQMADGKSRKVDVRGRTIGGVKLISIDHKGTNGYLDVLANPFPTAK